MKKLFLIMTILAFTCRNVIAKNNLEDHEAGIWTITGMPSKDRWIVIHNFDEAKKTGIFHIEVIARKMGNPAWDIEHEVNHLAITKEALEASVKEPLTKGAVYPEHFHEAFSKWQKINSGRGGKVCTISIDKCIKKQGVTRH